MTETLKPEATWRSPVLEESKRLDLAGGSLDYFDVGDGPVVAFVHGLFVNANTWRGVVERLKSDFRCVVFDLPAGAHSDAVPPRTGRGPVAVADLVAEGIEALDLEDVTLVGNDSGGFMCQAIATSSPERIGRLVLTSCDFRDNYPPKLFRYLVPVSKVPPAYYLLIQSLRIPWVRNLPIGFGWLTLRPVEDRVAATYLLPNLTSARVRRDTRDFIRGVDRKDSNRVADRLREFEKPALIAWSAEDKVFPPADATALAAALPESRLEWIDDAYTFSMEDNPDRLASLIRGFAAPNSPVASPNSPAAK